MIQNKFNKFLQHRQSLLFQYKMGDLTKNEFIERNFDTISRLGIKPFWRIDNTKKAIYNYQYYNVLAKYYYRQAMDFPKVANKEVAYCRNQMTIIMKKIR